MAQIVVNVTSQALNWTNNIGQNSKLYDINESELEGLVKII